MYKILVLISGNGSNLQHLIDNSKNMKYKIVGVISNKKNAYGLERAKNNNIPNVYFPYIRKEISREKYDEKLANYILNNYDFNLIILAGWMHIFSNNFLKKIKNIINLHPALPNQFPGKNAIHSAYKSFKNNNISKTGIMVHRVTDILDKGEIIRFKDIPILYNDLEND